MAHGNAETLRRVLAAGTRADFEAVREFLDPELEFAPHITGGFEGAEFHGFEGLESFSRLRAETWETLRAEPAEIRENGDLMVVLGTIYARGRGSGVEVEEPTVWLCRFHDGRLLRIEARAAREPGQIAWALAEAGLPPDAFDAH
ncbi:MAG TPA: nuclear transport factor 2 family protein [Solirubrobacteraceae bacterium]|nr:nuclear transport factor 2 family protein [Solirubrobacteraceae bacterium]